MKKSFPYLYKSLSDSLKITPNSSSSDVSDNEHEVHDDDSQNAKGMVPLDDIKETSKVNNF
jgi:hypothetical protein